MKIRIILLCMIVLCSCKKDKAHHLSEVVTSDSICYAKGFHVDRFSNYSVVDIRNPWDTTRLLQRYILVKKEEPIPTKLPKGTIVRVPLQRMVVYTSVHASIIEKFGKADCIVGLCEPEYIESSFLKDRLTKGLVADLGKATHPDIEKMITINPEVVIASPFDNSGYGAVEKLGIPIIEAADYMEALPLGRSEWIRFYGLLMGCESKADSLFHATETHYHALKELTKGIKKRPTVITEKKFGGSWFVPARDSYMAALLMDAGANYLFQDKEGSGSIPLSFEQVFERGIHADFWLLKYNSSTEMNYSILASEYAPYANFDAYKNHSIFVANTAKVPYYEEMPLYPDRLLENFIWIFHPELLPDYIPRYYNKLDK